MDNNKNIIILAPHPDDETLGCGGTILKHISEGFNVYWLIFTKLDNKHSYSKIREKEINKVKKEYSFKDVYRFNFKTAKLDTYPIDKIISKMKKVIEKVKPFLIYAPYNLDSHSDHRVVFNCMSHFSKSFRYSFIKEIRLYETLSETENSILTFENNFNPNVWVDISNFIKKKCKIFKIYKSENGKYPFPRSEESIKSLAKFRGSTSNLKVAESFIMVKRVEN